MKYIVRIVVSAFALISAAACYNNEIDNPDNPQNPEQSGLRITATMAKTRVNYGNETDEQLLPVWEPDDILFGFYVGGDGQIQNFILTVIGIGTNDGNSTATLGFVEGNENGLANQPVNTPVYLIYTGKNGANSITDADKFTSDGFPVDLTSQNLGRIPVCMSATATIGGTDDAKTLSFDFAYDCAVLKIESLTGIAEDSGLTGNLTLPLSSLTISNLILGGTYSFSNGSFEFTPSDNVTEAKTFDLSGGDWTIDKSGIVGSQSGKKILIAVAPNSNDAEIIVTAEAGAQGQEKTFSYSYGTRSLVSGTCYVAKAKPVVAKTADGQYFTSVKAAFDHASTLSSTYEDDNTVTLVKDLIFGLDEDVTHESDEYEPTIIDIYYSVTLDLNGCTLSLDFCEDEQDELYLCSYDSFYSGGFNVVSGGTLTITDTDSGEAGCIDSGSKGSPIIENSGTGIVNIEGGSLSHWVSCQVINSKGGTLNVSGGELYAYASPAVILSGTGTSGFIYGGLIENANEEETVPTYYETIEVLDGAGCNISGGVIHSYGNSPTIGCRSVSPNISKLTITWPDGIAPASPSKDSKHEPLIYAAAPDTRGFSNLPISAYDASRTNTAVVSLQGGYLISNPKPEFVGFYAGDGGKSNYYNLDYENFGGFYSNKGKILMSGSSNNAGDLTSGFVIKSGTPPVTLSATSQGEGSGFTMPLINEVSGDLYYMDK